MSLPMESAKFLLASDGLIHYASLIDFLS